MKILATSWHPGGANAIAPVIKKLKEEGADVSVIGYQESEKIFKSNGIDYKKADDVSLDSMRRLLLKESPNLVLTGTSCQDNENKEVIEQTVTLAAKEKGIKSLAVLDFWGNYCSRFSDLYNKDGKFRFLPDKIAVMDQLAVDAMVKEGFPEEILVATGNPHFDNLAVLCKQFSEEDRNQVRMDLGLGLDSYVLMYASQPIEFYCGKDESNPKFLGYTEKTALVDLVDALDGFDKRIELLVKVHPKEKKEDFDSNAYHIDQDYDTRRAVLAADLIITPFSTVGIEAALMDKPVVSLQPGLKKDDSLITNSLGVSIPVYRKEDISPVLDKMLFDKDYQKGLAEKRKNFSVDGKATERVVNLVYEMLK